jgi:hypothetical protein
MTLRGTVAVDPVDARTSGAMMLAAAVALPLLPGHPGIECPLRRLTGVPCPFCGMTTSTEATMRGHLGRALSANPGGVAAVVVAFALLVLRPRRIELPTYAPPLALCLLWLFELHRYAII